MRVGVADELGERYMRGDMRGVACPLFGGLGSVDCDDNNDDR